MKTLIFASSLLVLLFASKPLVADTPTGISLDGDVLKPSSWSARQISGGSFGTRQVIHYSDQGTEHSADCVSLLSVVNSGSPMINSHIKNHRLQFMIQVTGRDGYTVDFSFAELLPEFGNQAAWLAFDQNNKPLPRDSEPAELIVPGDTKHGRWVRSVVEITVIDGAALDSKRRKA